jgi:hypothetical protein
MAARSKLNPGEHLIASLEASAIVVAARIFALFLRRCSETSELQEGDKDAHRIQDHGSLGTG